MNDILDGYARASSSLIARYDALCPAQIYAPVIDLLPTPGARVADIGSGTGRDAAWFAERGHDVLAVEPVNELREAGKALHGCARIEWLDDRLPQLSEARSRGRFDLLTVCAVWQHIDDRARQLAMKSLAQMTAMGGLLIMSLRQGSSAPDRRTFPVSPEETILAASLTGFDLVRRAEVESVQAKSIGPGWP